MPLFSTDCASVVEMSFLSKMTSILGVWASTQLLSPFALFVLFMLIVVAFFLIGCFFCPMMRRALGVTGFEEVLVLHNLVDKIPGSELVLRLDLTEELVICIHSRAFQGLRNMLNIFCMSKQLGRILGKEWEMSALKDQKCFAPVANFLHFWWGFGSWVIEGQIILCYGLNAFMFLVLFLQQFVEVNITSLSNHFHSCAKSLEGKHWVVVQYWQPGPDVPVTLYPPVGLSTSLWVCQPPPCVCSPTGLFPLHVCPPHRFVPPTGLSPHVWYL